MAYCYLSLEELAIVSVVTHEMTLHNAVIDAVAMLSTPRMDRPTALASIAKLVRAGLLSRPNQATVGPTHCGVGAAREAIRAVKALETNLFKNTLG